MISVLDTLEINNRDISLGIWLAVLFIWAIREESVRKAISNLFKVITQRKILVTLILMLVYIYSLVYLLYFFHIWEIGNLKDTIFWLFGSAFVLYVNINRVKEDRYIINSIIESVKVVVLIEFLVNLYVFSIWIELILVPFLFLVWGMLGYTSVYKEYKQTENFLSKVLAVVGIVILIFTIISIAKNYQIFFSPDNLRDFIIPISLAIGFTPFIYFFGLYILYESIFTRIKIFSVNSKIAFYAKVKTLLAFHLNLLAVRSWSQGMGVLELRSKQDIRDAINAFKS